MGYSLDLDVLRKKLSRAKILKESPEYLLKEPPAEIPKGLQYLIQNVLNPLSCGQRVHSGDIDFSCFNDNDVVDLYDYYMDHFFDGTKDWYALKTVYTTCKNAVSQSTSVCFI